MAAVSNKFRDLLQVSALLSYCWPPTLAGQCLQGELRQESELPRSGPCLTPGVLGRGAGGSKSVSFEAWKQIQPICTAAPAGGCVKNTGSSCRARRNVAPFVFTKHRVVVDSAFSGEEILIAFPSLPFSLTAQHVVKLSRASLGNTEDRLLVEKSCSSQVSPPFPNGNTPQHRAEGSLDKSTVLCGMLGPVALKFHSGLWQGEEQGDLIPPVERNQAKESILNHICYQLCTLQRGQTIFCLALQFTAARCLQASSASEPS